MGDFAHHWIALDRAFSRVLPPAQAAHARQRLAHRAEAVSDIYVPRLVRLLREPADRSNLTREVRELEDVHRALTAALAAAREGEDVDPTDETGASFESL